MTLGPAHAVQGGLQAQVLAAGEERIEGRLLQRGTDGGANLGSLADDVEAGDARRPCAEREERRQHVDRRRLAGAVRAEKPVDLAGCDREVDPVDGSNPSLELPRKALRLDSVLVAHAARLPKP